jgi:hypothetical protein
LLSAPFERCASAGQNTAVQLLILLRLNVLRHDVEEKFPDAENAKLWIEVKAPN